MVAHDTKTEYQPRAQVDIFSNLEVSFFNRIDSKRPDCKRRLSEVFQSFVSDEYRQKVEYLRTLSIEEYKAKKTRLSGVTFSGVFTNRNNDQLESFTNLMCLDFDEVENPEQFRDGLKFYSFIYAAWISPSGRGVKCLVVIPNVDNDQEYKKVFKQVQKVFPAIDSACSDLARLCFVCWDPSLWTNPGATMFELSFEYFEEVKPTIANADLTPLNDFNQRADERQFLEGWQWTFLKSIGSNDHYCRPGKQGATSATWSNEKRLFYVFTSSTQLEPARAYNLSALYCYLECSGDFSETAKRLYALGYGERHKLNARNESVYKKVEQPTANIFRIAKHIIMEKPKKLFGPLWADGENAFLFAEDGACKSILAVQVACSIATGQQISGFQTEVPAQPVALFDAELSDFQFYNRYPEGLPGNFNRLTFNEDMQSALAKADLQFVVNQIENASTELQSKIIILDNLAALTSMIDATKTSDAIRLMGLLNDLKKKGFSILIIDHCRKPMKENEFKTISKHDMQGSKMKTNLVDSVFSIGKSCQGENYRYIKALKIRSYEMAFTKSAVATMYLKTAPLRLEFVGLDAEWTHVNDRNSQAAKMSNEGKSQAEIASTFGVSQQFVSKLLRDA